MLRKCIPLALLVAGCTTTRYTPTMEADPTEVGNEGLALLTEMAQAYERVAPEDTNSLCQLLLPSYQEKQKYTYGRYKTSPRDKVEDKFRCYRFKTKPVDGEVARYLRSGFALSDIYCDTYFRRIALRWSQRRFARDTTNDVGAAISAVLGLAKVASPVTGGVGAGFGLIDGTFRNYDEIFVVSPDLPGLQKLVRAERAKLKREVSETKAFPVHFADAHAVIQNYAGLCSYVGMKGLLSESMERQARESSGSGRVEETYTEFMTRKEREAAELEERRADLAERQSKALQRRLEAEKALGDANGNGGATTEPPPDGTSDD